MITVKPTSGFANRLRVIDSSLLLAKNYNHDLRIIWERNYELNCRFWKIFSEELGFNVTEKYVSRLKAKFSKKIPGMMKRSGIKFPFGYDIVLVDDEIEKIKKISNDFSFCRDADKIYIHSCHYFFVDKSSFKWFKPSENITKQADRYISGFSDNTIGVHIRRGDNITSIKYSRLSEFIRLMRIETERNENCQFFLATDSPIEEEKLKKEFGKRIITHKKILNRNSEQGIIDAIVDLWCLASTNKIIGSHYSSFSEVAAQLKGIELVQAYIPGN